MSSVQRLREVVRERLAAAAEEICGEFEKVIFQYEEEIKYQRRLLEISWRPKMKTRTKDFPQQPDDKEDEFLTDWQLWNQERNSTLEEQEELCTSREGEVLVVKLEADAFMDSPVCEESDQSEAEPVSEQQDKEGSQDVDSGSTKDEPRTKRRRLTSEVLDVDKTDAAQPHDCKEDIFTVCQLWSQERNSSLDQEDHNAARVKVEEEELWTSQERESDTFVVAPTFEENNSKTESNSEQLLSHCSPDTKSQDQGAGRNVNAGSNKHNEPKKSQMKKLDRNHTMDETKVCYICGKSFSQRCILLEHMKIHTVSNHEQRSLTLKLVTLKTE
ncbi:uncharacterized protein KZ484_025381 isoform 2-T2 [Pholidichthys leucotaenia]